MEDAPKSLKIPKSECPDIWIRLPRHKRPKTRSSMEDPVVPLERNLYGDPLAGLLWERQFEKILLNGWEKVPNWECLFVHRKRGTMVKRSIEQDTRNMNYGARSGNYERNAVVKNPRTKQRGQGMGSPRHGCNRRERTRKGPEFACVQTPLSRGGTRREEG